MVEDTIDLPPHQFPVTKTSNFEESPDLEGMENPFGVDWEIIERKQKINSPYMQFNSYSLKSMIFKSNDDLRQELLAI